MPLLAARPMTRFDENARSIPAHRRCCMALACEAPGSVMSTAGLVSTHAPALDPARSWPRRLANCLGCRLASASRKVAWEAALVYELGGNRDLAIKALRDAMIAGQALEEVKREPALANLRSDPRFAQLMTDRASKSRQ